MASARRRGTAGGQSVNNRHLVSTCLCGYEARTDEQLEYHTSRHHRHPSATGDPPWDEEAWGEQESWVEEPLADVVRITNACRMCAYEPLPPVWLDATEVECPGCGARNKVGV